MSESLLSDWQPRSAWAGFARAGRHGAVTGEPGVRLTLREGLSLATIIAADGQDEKLEGIFSERLGLPVPGMGGASLDESRRLVWSGPHQWLAVAEEGALKGLPDALRGIAAVTDQSDSRAILGVAGANARDCLAKGIALDLHPRAFCRGSAALTAIAHMGVQLWQTDDAPAYELTVARSYAGSLWSWLEEASAEYELAVTTA